ncbi:hypothetical protein PVNG_03828 [Plasmodium vivax North Korean]|uniref:Uncharacterized protein n=1 Tax=Plasmodium vivax North Korean TaxID=1035514 RepID=A0A0J9TTU4_PLAVI|nr:hypothetical protein PVNG_03828 [Plasmodium vivax North Korean]
MTTVSFGNTNVCKINSQSSCHDLYTDIIHHVKEKFPELQYAENVNEFISECKELNSYLDDYKNDCNKCYHGSFLRSFDIEAKLTLPNNCDVTNLSIFEDKKQYCSACNPEESSVKDIPEASCSNSDGKHTYDVSTSEDTEKDNLHLKYAHANSKSSYIVIHVNELSDNELYNNSSDTSRTSCVSPETCEYSFYKETHPFESPNITNVATVEVVSEDVLPTAEEPSPPTALSVVNSDVTPPSGHASHTHGTFYYKNCVYFFQIISVLNYKYYFYNDTTSYNKCFIYICRNRKSNRYYANGINRA